MVKQYQKFYVPRFDLPRDRGYPGRPAYYRAQRYAIILIMLYRYPVRMHSARIRCVLYLIYFLKWYLVVVHIIVYVIPTRVRENGRRCHTVRCKSIYIYCTSGPSGTILKRDVQTKFENLRFVSRITMSVTSRNNIYVLYIWLCYFILIVRHRHEGKNHKRRIYTAKDNRNIIR